MELPIVLTEHDEQQGAQSIVDRVRSLFQYRAQVRPVHAQVYTQMHLYVPSI